MGTNFSNIKERILQITDYKKITKEKFFSELGMSYSSFKGKAKNKSLNSDALATVVSKYPEINPSWLLTGKGEMLHEDLQLDELKKSATAYKEPKQPDNRDEGVPLVPIDVMAGFGDGEIQVSERDVIGRYRIPEFDGKGVEYMIRVSGSSMYPTYSNGDLLGCRPFTDTSFFQWGKPYVLDTNQGVVIKRLFPVSGGDELLECRSDNEENYPPFVIRKSAIYRIAIVVGVLRME